MSRNWVILQFESIYFKEGTNKETNTRKNSNYSQDPIFLCNFGPHDCISFFITVFKEECLTRHSSKEVESYWVQTNTRLRHSGTCENLSQKHSPRAEQANFYINLLPILKRKQHILTHLLQKQYNQISDHPQKHNQLCWIVWPLFWKLQRKVWYLSHQVSYIINLCKCLRHWTNCCQAANNYVHFFQSCGYSVNWFFEFLVGPQFFNKLLKSYKTKATRGYSHFDGFEDSNKIEKQSAFSPCSSKSIHNIFLGKTQSTLLQFCFKYLFFVTNNWSTNSW